MALEDKMDGIKDQATGKVKEVTGAATGDVKQAAEDKAKGMMGKTKQVFGDAKGAADMVEDVKEKFEK